VRSSDEGPKITLSDSLCTGRVATVAPGVHSQPLSLTLCSVSANRASCTCAETVVIIHGFRFLVRSHTWCPVPVDLMCCTAAETVILPLCVQSLLLRLMYCLVFPCNPNLVFCLCQPGVQFLLTRCPVSANPVSGLCYNLASGLCQPGVLKG